LNAPSCQGAFITMNTTIAPWNDVHVRRAVAYAVSRPDIVKASGGYDSARDTFIPTIELRTVASQAQINHLLGSINLYPHSIAKAKQEMAQSAYPNGVDTSIITFDYGRQADMSQVVVSELAQVGIHAKLQVETLAKAVADGSGPAAKRPTAVWGGGCTDPDVSGYDFYLGSANTAVGSWNLADYTPPVIDQLLKTGETASSTAARWEAYSKLLTQLSVDVPYVPLLLHGWGMGLASNFRAVDFNYWTFLNDNYALWIKPT
jgi:peptide/nickel transport system substrate-binding protein